MCGCRLPRMSAGWYTPGVNATCRPSDGACMKCFVLLYLDGQTRINISGQAPVSERLSTYFSAEDLRRTRSKALIQLIDLQIIKADHDKLPPDHEEALRFGFRLLDSIPARLPAKRQDRQAVYLSGRMHMISVPFSSRQRWFLPTTNDSVHLDNASRPLRLLQSIDGQGQCVSPPGRRADGGASAEAVTLASVATAASFATT